VYKLCRIDIERSEEIYKRLREFISKIKKRFPIHQVYLYGSFARGQVHEGSDIDLVVVGDFKEPFFDRISKILEITDLPIEPLVYTPQEFNEMKKRGNPLIMEVLKRGKSM